MNALKIVKNDFSVRKEVPWESFLKDRLVISTHTRLFLVHIPDINYIKAESNYSQIRMTDGNSILATSVLKRFETRLIGHLFIRIHASYLINLHQLNHIKKNGEYHCIMNDGTEIPVSKKYRESMIEEILRNKM